MKLIVNEPGTFIGSKSGRVRVRKEGKVISEIAAPLLDQLVITTRGASLSSGLIRLLAKHHVQVIFLNGFGFPIARLVTSSPGTVALRHRQYAIQDTEEALLLARKFVSAKMNNQAVLLSSSSRNRTNTKPEISRYLNDYSREIRDYIGKLSLITFSSAWRSEIMRIEAEASEVYWEGVKLILKDHVEFPGRKKRFDQPNDTVNVLLNYGYSFLAAHVWANVESVGLDPYAGFLHVDSPRRPALVMDLIEEFRQPVVDRTVFRLVSEKLSEIKVESSKLSRESRILFLKALSQRLEQKVTFQDRSLPIESHIMLQSRRLAEAIMGREDYLPYSER